MFDCALLGAAAAADGVRAGDAGDGHGARDGAGRSGGQLLPTATTATTTTRYASFSVTRPVHQRGGTRANMLHFFHPLAIKNYSFEFV